MSKTRRLKNLPLRSLVALSPALALAAFLSSQGVSPAGVAATVLPFPGMQSARTELEVATSDEQLSTLARRTPAVRFLAVDLEQVSEWSLGEIARMQNLAFLELRGPAATAKVPAALSAAARAGIRALDLRPLAATLRARQVEGLSRLDRLEILRVGELHTPSLVGDEVVAAITSLSHLRQLSLVGTPLSSYGLGQIASMRNLTELDLDQTLTPADHDYAALAYLPKLRRLNLARTQAGDHAVSSLRSLRNLRFLDLESSGVTDAGLEFLLTLPLLEELSLAETSVTDRSVSTLAGMQHLDRLNTRGCVGITARGRAQLEASGLHL